MEIPPPKGGVGGGPLTIRKVNQDGALDVVTTSSWHRSTRRWQRLVRLLRTLPSLAASVAQVVFPTIWQPMA